MTNLFRIILSSVVVSVFVSSLSAAILSPEKRSENIESAKEFVELKPILITQEEVDEIGDPFSRSRLIVGEKEVTVVLDELSDAAVLEGVSRELVPDGVFQVNGVYYALFKGARVKAGEVISRRFMDREYDIIFDKLDSKVFSIRYGEARLEIKLK